MLAVLFSFFDKPVKFCALKITFSVAFDPCENCAQSQQVLIKFGIGNILQTCQANWIFGHAE